MITPELERSPVHSQVRAGTQPQPLETPLCCRTLLTNLRASMGAVYVRHRLWGMSFVTHMSLSAPGNTHPSARQPQEGEVQATKMIPGMATSCCGGIQAAPRAGASSAPATSRHWSVQDYHEIVLPESQCVCMVTVHLLHFQPQSSSQRKQG